MSDRHGQRELARRLHRIFITNIDTGQQVADETLMRFAGDILEADYTDPRYGPRPGDGGPAMDLRPRRPDA